MDQTDEKGIRKYFKELVIRELSRDREDLELSLLATSEKDEPEKFKLLKM